jgi:hypothetical protein
MAEEGHSGHVRLAMVPGGFALTINHQRPLAAQAPMLPVRRELTFGSGHRSGRAGRPDERGGGIA